MYNNKQIKCRLRKFEHFFFFLQKCKKICLQQFILIKNCFFSSNIFKLLYRRKIDLLDIINQFEDHIMNMNVL